MVSTRIGWKVFVLTCNVINVIFTFLARNFFSKGSLKCRFAVGVVIAFGFSL